MSIDNLFPGFNAFFYDFSTFPEKAIVKIPKSLHFSIDSGNATFFSDLKVNFPKLYRALVSDCSNICLLEQLSIGMGLNNLGKEQVNYFWGLKCKENILIIGIPTSSPNNEIFKSISKPYLDCLPDEFRCFYQKMDGFCIANNNAPEGYDLPSGFSNWFELADFIENINGDDNTVAALYDSFPESDFRVFVKCSNNDLIVCDFSGKADGLYFLKNDHPSIYKKIEHPVEIMDSYFASAVIGKPNYLTL